MKNCTQWALFLVVLILMSSQVYAGQKDSSYVLANKHLTFKFDVFSPLKKCISLAIEKDLGYRQSIEIGLGLFDAESDPDFIKENGGISGAYIRIGPKFYLKKKYFGQANINGGLYFRPEMVAQYSFLNQPRTYDFKQYSPYFIIGNETHEDVSFGTILNFGYQYELGDKVVVDGFVGLGITYLIEKVKQSAYPNYFATLENTYITPINSSSRGIGLGSQAGVKIGIRIF